MITIAITGTITDVFPVEHIGNFRKRVFWIVETERVDAPQVLALEAWNQDVEMPIKEKTGQVLNFHVEIRGKKWEKNGRAGIFNTLRCVGIFDRANKSPMAKEDFHDEPPF